MPHGIDIHSETVLILLVMIIVKEGRKVFIEISFVQLIVVYHLIMKMPRKKKRENSSCDPIVKILSVRTSVIICY